MRAQLFFFAISLVATSVGCSGDGPGSDTGPTDGSTDTSPTDGGTDTTTPPTDSSMDTSTDTGPTGCVTDCEFVDVVSGATHSCALRANGTVWCWGGNIKGTLGDGVMNHMIQCGLLELGDVPDCSGPVEVSIIDDATQLSARGGRENCVIRESGGVWCWGLQGIGPATGGEPGVRFEPEERMDLGDFETVSGGSGLTCGVAAGQSVCIGRNFSGQIGDGAKLDVRVPFTIPTPTGVTVVEAASMAMPGMVSDFTCALADGAAWCWGNNDEGQLGDEVGDHMGGCMLTVTMYDCSLVPVPVTMPTGITFTDIKPGGSHVCALGSDSNAWCWGANNYGQLGDGTLDRVNTPIQVTDSGDVAALDTGRNFTCLLYTSGAVSCFGDNQEGQVGDGSMDHGGDCGDTKVGCCGPIGGTDCSWDISPVDGLTDATALGLGGRHACAVRVGGDVVCWGYNTKMQLGDGTRDRRPSPVVVMDLGD